MRIYGIDFTSRPRRGKPITCLHGQLDGDRLIAGQLACWSDFEPFEAFLNHPGPWIAGLDFPFGQSRTFLTNIVIVPPAPSARRSSMAPRWD